VLIDGYPPPLKFDLYSFTLVEQCYGYIPLSTIFDGDTSDVTITSVSGLPGQGSDTGLSGVVIGDGIDLSHTARNHGDNLTGQSCIILKWLPASLKGSTETPSLTWYYDINVTLDKGGVPVNLIIRLEYAGLVDGSLLD